MLMSIGVLLHFYELITVPIYLRIIYVLIQQKQFFRRPFWRIFCIASILDIFFYLLTLLLYRFPLHPIFQSFYANLPESRWIGWIMFAAFLTIYLQNFLHFLICLNRFTGICFPFRHEKFWSQTYRFWLIFSFVFAFGLSVNRLFTKGKFTPLIASDHAKGYVPIPTQFDFYFIRQELITTILGTICALICVALNSITLFLIIRHRNNQQIMQTQIQPYPHQQTQNHQNLIGSASNNHSVEIRLFFITLWTMFAQLLFNTFELLIYYILGAYTVPVEYFILNKDACIYNLFSDYAPWITDIYTLSQTWAALILSSDLRVAAFPRIFKYRSSTTVGIVVVQSSTKSSPIINLK